MGDFVRRSAARVSATFGRRRPVVVKGLGKQEDEDDAHEMLVRGRTNTNADSCIVCVGSTGSGKSSTISKFTLQRAASSSGFDRETTQCSMYRPEGEEDGPVWVDTVGWDDRDFDDQTTFQDLLRFLQSNNLRRVRAVVWTVIPNVRRDALLTRQAKFIDQLQPKRIWRNVIVVCKQSMNPERDGQGAAKAAEEYSCAPGQVQLVGYRFYEDHSLSQEQRDKFADAETRRLFNVKTNDEIRELLRERITACDEPVGIEMRPKKCMDCGESGDPRLLPLFCHLESHHVHAGLIREVHPLPVEIYHELDGHVAEHEGKLRRPLYSRWAGVGGKRYSCCGKRPGKPGCTIKWTCCRQVVLDHSYLFKTGCKRRYECCKAEVAAPSAGDGDEPKGCQNRFVCCGAKVNEQGCQELCRKCDKPWGTPTDDCYRKEHNLTELPTESNGEYARKDSVLVNGEQEIKYVLGLPPIVSCKPY